MQTDSREEVGSYDGLGVWQDKPWQSQVSHKSSCCLPHCLFLLNHLPPLLIQGNPTDLWLLRRSLLATALSFPAPVLIPSSGINSDERTEFVLYSEYSKGQ